MPRPADLCPRGTVGDQPLVDLRNACFSLPLLGQGPAPVHSPHRQPERKPLLGTEGNFCLGQLFGDLYLPAEVMEPRSTAQGKSQAVGVSQLLSEGENLITSLQGLLWIAQRPQGPGQPV